LTVRNRQPAALAIIVPTYNERDRLSDLIERIFASYVAHAIDGEIVVVDDNSPDGTGALADELATRYRITVLHRAGKMGLGTAVIEGFAAASAPIVGVMDADLSHPPDLLPGMLAVMHSTSADVVIGSRYIPGGGTRGWGVGRLLMSRFACVLAHTVTPMSPRHATESAAIVRRSTLIGVGRPDRSRRRRVGPCVAPSRPAIASPASGVPRAGGGA